MMKYMILIFLFSTSAYGGTFFKFGLGVDNTLGNTKFLSGGFQGPLLGIFDYQLEGGAFADNDQPQGIIGFGGADLGLSVHTNCGVFAKLFVGPALITSTDTRLSSVFEFNEDAELGLRDNNGISIGLDFKHFSNAGLVLPNVGRDFMLLKVELPF